MSDLAALTHPQLAVEAHVTCYSATRTARAAGAVSVEAIRQNVHQISGLVVSQ